MISLIGPVKVEAPNERSIHTIGCGVEYRAETLGSSARELTSRDHTHSKNRSVSSRQHYSVVLDPGEVVKITAGLLPQVALALVEDVVHNQVSLSEVAADSQKRNRSIVADLAEGQVLAEPVTEVHRAEVRSVENETCVAVDSSEDDRYKDQVETVVSEFTELALAWNEKLV